MTLLADDLQGQDTAPASAPVRQAPPITSPDEPQQVEAQDSPPAAPGAETKPSKSSAQRRFDELTRRNYELDALNARLLERLDGIEQKLTVAVKPAEVQPPDRLNYGNDTEWASAFAEWQRSKILGEIAEQQKTSTAKLQENQRLESLRHNLQQTWHSMEEGARQRYGDYDDVIQGVGDLYTPALAQVVLQSPMGADIAYHLATNYKDLLRLRQMDVASAAREVGRIESMLEAKVAAPAVSQAPVPISPLRGATKQTVLADNMSDEEWIHKRNEQARKRRRG
jgi:hypothetical protein